MELDTVHDMYVYGQWVSEKPFKNFLYFLFAFEDQKVVTLPSGRVLCCMIGMRLTRP